MTRLEVDGLRRAGEYGAGSSRSALGSGRRKASVPIPPPVPELDSSELTEDAEDASDASSRTPSPSPPRRRRHSGRSDRVAASDISRRPPAAPSPPTMPEAPSPPPEPTRHQYRYSAGASAPRRAEPSVIASTSGSMRGSATALHSSSMQYRRPTVTASVRDDNSRLSSRRSDSQRDYSPSARLDRSSRLSRISSMTSVTESEDESEEDTDDMVRHKPRRVSGGSQRQREMPVARHHASPYREGSRHVEPGSHMMTRQCPTIVAEVISPSESEHSSRSSSPDPRHYSLAPRRAEEPAPFQRCGTMEANGMASRHEPRTQPQASRRSRRREDSEHPPSTQMPPMRRAATASAASSVASRSVASSRRSSSFLGNFFGPAIQPHHADRPNKFVECVVCLDDIPARKTAKLKCGHRMCNACLKRSFKLSITDPQHMPPKCCTVDAIPLKHVDRLFDIDFKKTWNKKFVEFSARNRIYCPARQCGEFIKPENIHHEDGRKMGKCSRCRTKVCVACNGKWHTSRHCPKDEDTAQILAQAKKEGWQRCFRCKTIVELKEGCNHMTCRCGAEFCMVCGVRWKTCECPWFNYDAVEADRLLHMQFAMPFDDERATSEDVRDSPSQPNPFERAARSRPWDYEEEQLMRHIQEEEDRLHAMRARRSDSFGYEDRERERSPGRDYTDVVGIGNASGHYMNESYRRPQAVHMASTPPRATSIEAQGSSPADRSKDGTDYLSGVNKARGVRASTSLERRLADRLNHSSPPQRAPVLHSPPLALRQSATMPLAPMVPPMPPMPMLQRRATTEETVHRSSAGRSARKTVKAASRETSLTRSTRSATEDDESVTSSSISKKAKQHRRDPPRQSMMAGLTGRGSGANRVTEWRTHVAPGVPEASANSKAKRSK